MHKSDSNLAATYTQVEYRDFASQIIVAPYCLLFSSSEDTWALDFLVAMILLLSPDQEMQAYFLTTTFDPKLANWSAYSQPRTAYEESEQAVESTIKPLKKTDGEAGTHLKRLKPYLKHCRPELVSTFVQQIESLVKEIEHLRTQKAHAAILKAKQAELRKLVVDGACSAIIGTIRPLLLDNDKPIKETTTLVQQALSGVMQDWIKDLKKLLALSFIAQLTETESAAVNITRFALATLKNLVQVSEHDAEISQLRQSEFTGDNKRSVNKQAAGNKGGKKGSVFAKWVLTNDSLPPEAKQISARVDGLREKIHFQPSKARRGGHNSAYQQENNAQIAPLVKYQLQLSPLAAAVQQLNASTGSHFGLTHPSDEIDQLRELPQYLGYADLPLLQTTHTTSLNLSGVSTSPLVEAHMMRQRLHFYLDENDGQVKLFEGAVYQCSNSAQENMRSIEAIESFQIGVPISALLPIAIEYYRGQLSLNQCCDKLMVTHGISLKPSTFKQVLTRMEPIVQGISSIIETSMLVCNTSLHADETFYPLYVFDPQEGRDGYSKRKVTQYVLAAVSPPSADFQGVVYKRSPSRSKKSILTQFGPFFNGSNAIITDRYAAYKAIMTALDGVNQYCCAHLLRYLAVPTIDALQQMAEMEANFIKAKGEEFDRKRGFTPEQLDEFKLELKAYWDQLAEATVALINACFLLVQLFVAEQVPSLIWYKTFDKSSHFAEHGTLSDEERAFARRRILRFRRKFCAPLVASLEAEIERAKTKNGSQTKSVKDAVAYYENGKEGFKAFLTHPEISIDNNASERAVKPIAWLRKLNRINQSPQSLDGACRMLSLIYTLLLQGYGIDVVQTVLQYVLDKLFVHTVEQSANEEYKEKHNLDGLNGKLRQVNLLTYLHSFPIAKHFFDVLERERKRINKSSSSKKPIAPWPEKAVTKSLEDDQQRMEHETSVYAMTKANTLAKVAADLADKAAARAKTKALDAADAANKAQEEAKAASKTKATAEVTAKVMEAAEAASAYATEAATKAKAAFKAAVKAKAAAENVASAAQKAVKAEKATAAKDAIEALAKTAVKAKADATTAAKAVAQAAVMAVAKSKAAIKAMYEALGMATIADKEKAQQATA